MFLWAGCAGDGLLLLLPLHGLEKAGRQRAAGVHSYK